MLPDFEKKLYLSSVLSLIITFFAMWGLFGQMGAIWLIQFKLYGLIIKNKELMLKTQTKRYRFSLLRVVFILNRYVPKFAWYGIWVYLIFIEISWMGLVAIPAFFITDIIVSGLLLRRVSYAATKS